MDRCLKYGGFTAEKFLFGGRSVSPPLAVEGTYWFIVTWVYYLFKTFRKKTRTTHKLQRSIAQRRHSSESISVLICKICDTLRINLANSAGNKACLLLYLYHTIVHQNLGLWKSYLPTYCFSLFSARPACLKRPFTWPIHPSKGIHSLLPYQVAGRTVRSTMNLHLTYIRY